jgi:hypothetical protein
MDLNDIVSGARKSLDGHEDQAKDVAEKAGDLVKDRTDLPDGAVDAAVDKITDLLDPDED